ncbi:MAG: O-antigen ligase family protein [Candidatus Pacebacteria bacterium]|nr:O-antigen ligase family protein [Candidatus Paceibacterota bacterium]
MNIAQHTKSPLTTGLRYFIIACIFLIPFTPLVFYKYLFFPYITGKNFYFRILIELALAAYLVLIAVDPTSRPRRSPLLVALLSFGGIMAIATIFSLNPFKSFWSNFERMDGYITTLHLIAFFIVTTGVLNTRRLWFWLWNTTLGASVIVGIVALQDLFANPPIGRIYGTLGNSTYLGVYSLIHIFLAVFFLVRQAQSEYKNKLGQASLMVLYSLVAIFDAYIMYNTGTRGSFLGLVAGAFFVLVVITFFGKKKNTDQNEAQKNTPKGVRVVAASILGVMVLTIAFFGIFGSTPAVANIPFFARFSAPIQAVLHGDFKSFAESEGKGRLLIWQAALQGAVQRPILGWGPESFNYVFNMHYSPAMYGQEQWFDRSHNVFLDWLIDGGVLGLIGYLALFVALLYIIWKKLGAENIGEDRFSLSDKAIVTGLLIAYFIHNLFVFDNLASYILFFFLLAYVHSLYVGRRRENGNGTSPLASFPLAQKKVNDEVGIYVVAPIVIVILCVGLYFFNLKPYEASASLIDALNPYVVLNPKLGMVSGNVRQRTPAEELAAFKQALSYNTFGNQEIREQILTAASQTISSTDTSTSSQAVKQTFFTLAQTEMAKQIKETPLDARPYILYGSFLSQLGQYDNALIYLNKALTLTPGKQSLLYQIGAAELNKKDYTDALATYKQAFDEDQTNDEARAIYAAAAIYAGKGVGAGNLADQILAGKILPDDRLIQAYFSIGQYAKVVALNEARVAANPTNGQYHVSLAAAYLQVGEKDKAIEQIKQAMAIEPKFQAQGEDLIKRIQSGEDILKSK